MKALEIAMMIKFSRHMTVGEGAKLIREFAGIKEDEDRCVCPAHYKKYNHIHPECKKCNGEKKEE